MGGEKNPPNKTSSQTVSSSEIHTLCKVEKKKKKTLRFRLNFTLPCSRSNGVQKSGTQVCQKGISEVRPS